MKSGHGWGQTKKYVPATDEQFESSDSDLTSSAMLARWMLWKGDPGSPRKKASLSDILSHNILN